MIRVARHLFDDTQLREAARRFGMDAAALTILDGYENLVYADDERVLRIAHDGLKDPEQVLGECRFLDHLAAGGAAVARPLPSLGDALLERLPDGHGGHFLVTCFERAPGEALSSSEAPWRVVERLGRLAGDLHRLAARYRPQGWRPRPWYEIEHVAGRHAHVADEPAAVRDAIEILYRRLRHLPHDPAEAGPIHSDLHGDNVLWDGERLTAIDFDDLQFGPWGMDLGIATYYCRWLLPAWPKRSEAERRDFVLAFVGRLARGYRRVRPLDATTQRHFADFVRWRRTDLFLYLHSARATRELDADEWAAMTRMRGEIAQGVPPLPVEDEALRAALAPGGG